MKVKTFTIERRATEMQNLLLQWQITVRLVPSWFETLVLAKQPETRVLIGSYTYWISSSGEPSMLWKFWAYNLIKNHLAIDHETTDFSG